LRAEAGDRILDLGCGPGYYARRLADLGCDVTLFDLSTTYLTQAAAHSSLKGRALSGTAEVLPFREGSFGKVIATEIIEHTLNPSRVVAEIARVLKPGGSAVITSPSSRSYMDRCYEIKRKLMGYKFNEHLQEFTGTSIVGLVERCLTVTRVTHANCLVPFPLDLAAMKLPKSFEPCLQGLEELFRSGKDPERFCWTVIVQCSKGQTANAGG